MKVVIVDDEPYMVEYIENLIDWNEYGFDEVITAHGGSMAKELIEKNKPELLITDIKMPRVSGLDLAQYIDEKGYDTKTLIISGYSDFEFAKQALSYGVKDYLVKPILKDDFEEAIDRIIEKYLANKNSKEVILKDKDAVVTYIIDYIADNYDKDLSLDSLGNIVHLHPAYLSKVFKETKGIGLLAYVTDVKMNKAAELLVDSDMKIRDIVLKVGYHKEQHFTKLFKNKYGITPKEYRLENLHLTEAK